MKTTLRHILGICLISLTIATISCTKKNVVKKEDPSEVTHKVLFETSAGNFTVELYGTGMKKTVNNFVTYVKDGFYDGLIFHRVVPNFVIQGGGFYPGMKPKKTREPVELEMVPSIEVTEESGKKYRKLLFSHDKYMLSMARGKIPDSATSQFFITLAPIKHLDPNPNYSEPNGYAVFGKVIDGFQTIDKIGQVNFTTKKGFPNVPVEDIIIKKATLIYDKKAVEMKKKKEGKV